MHSAATPTSIRSVPGPMTGNPPESSANMIRNMMLADEGNCSYPSLASTADSDDWRGSSSESQSRMILYTPEDDRWLSEPLCLLRQQIEAFAATPDDVKVRGTFGGRQVPLPVGRVGIRCIHCAHLPPKQRAKGAVTYPKSVRGMHQAVRNWQRYHFLACNEIPNLIKEKFLSSPAKGAQSKKHSTEYWIKCCYRMDMFDAPAGDGDGGIRFKAGVSISNADNTHNVEANTSFNTATRGPGFLNHSIAPAIGNTETALDGSVQKQSDGNLRTKGLSSEEDTAFRLETLEIEPTPLATNDTFHISRDLGSIDAGSLDHLNMFTSQHGLIGSMNASHSFINYASLAPNAFDSELEQFDTPERAKIGKNGASLKGGSFQIPSETTDTGIPVDALSERKTPPQHEHVRINSNMVDHSNVITSFDQQEGYCNMTPLTSSVCTTEKVAIRNKTNGVQDERTTLLESVSIASELVKTVQVGHESGVAYRDSIIGADYSPLSGDHIRSDLVQLGVELYKLFSGLDIDFPAVFGVTRDESGCTHGIEDIMHGSDSDHAADMTQMKKKKEERRPSRQNKSVPLRDLGLPVSLSIAVSSLLDANDDGALDRYHTAEEVAEDFRLMISDPERNLFDANADKISGQLELATGRLLYGRQKQIARLTDVFGHFIQSDGPPEVVLVSGYSGTGKSVLVDQLRQPLAEKKGHFVAGKFDELLGQVHPMSVIFAAFNEYCKDLLEGDVTTLAQTREAIKETLGHHSNVLTGLIPNLCKVIGEPITGTFQVGGLEAQNRLFFYFRLFMRTISSPSHPLILFLDDLQWADKASLELIGRIVSDSEMRSFLFVGSYRDNEVGADHPLEAEIRKISSASVSICHVKLENIGRENVNEMISDALFLPPRLTKSLADIVYAKTSGNPLFAVQFLRSLFDEHLLQYSASSRRWEWDVETIQSKDIADNVVGLMTSKMLKLDPGLQRLLKIAACLGSRSEASTLQFLCANSVCDELCTSFLLDLAVSEGLMIRTGTSYKFSHDQIQQAAYSLIPANEREALHVQIGRALWKKTAENELNNTAFIIIDQLHRGSNLISDHDEKVEIARLCLMAGEKAISSYAFMQASICLLQGSTLLVEKDWECHYNLSLRLFAACAEAQFVTGNPEGAIMTVDVIMKHGRSLEDKVEASYTLVDSLVSLGKLHDAITSGLDMLAQLGQVFPSEPNHDHVLKDFAKTRAMLDGISTKQILEKDEVKDPNKVAAMKLQNILLRFTYQTNHDLMSLLINRTVQMSLRFGVCQETPLAFAALGMLIGGSDEVEEGYQYGKLALSFLERFDAQEHHARVCVTVYGITNFVEPLQASLPTLKRGYEVGMSMGDINWALVNANVYSISALQWGIKLDSLAVEVRGYSRQMKECNNQMALRNSQVILQAILNLMGCSEDPTELTGDVMDQAEVMNTAIEKGDSNVTSMVYLLRMWLAYLFGRYDVAAEMAKHRQKMSKTRPARLDTIVNETFYTGLIAVVMARGGAEEGWAKIAYDSVEKLKTWAGNLAWNFQHKVDLLNGEIAYYMNGDLDGAAKAYNDAIRCAGAHRFVHEQALACERAGIFYSEAVNKAMGKTFFQQARTHYLAWGATRKAQELLDRVGESDII